MIIVDNDLSESEKKFVLVTVDVWSERDFKKMLELKKHL